MAATCLALDIGNSRLKAALLHQGQVAETFTPKIRLQFRRWRERYAALPLYVIDTRNDPAWKALITELDGRFLEAPAGLPFPTRYAATLGPDRCAALCALFYTAERPLLHLSFGTALTGDLLDANGTHLGGFISLGLNLRLKALHQHTGRLPQLPAPQNLPPLWGTSTAEAIWIGTLHGMLAEIQSYLRGAQTTLGPYHLYISGGEAPLLEPFLPQSVTFVPNLTLIGVWHWQRFLFGD